MAKKKRTSRGPNSDGHRPLRAVRSAWTAAAAARLARTARIATAAHLRHAEVARRWELGRMLSGYNLWREHLRAQAGEYADHVDEATITTLVQDLLYGGSGLSRPYPATTEDVVQALLERRALDLEAATLYVLSPSMCDVVVAAAQTLTIDDLGLLGPDDLPGPTGLVLLPFPVLVRAVNGSLADDRAYTWHVPAEVLVPHPITGRPQPRPAVRIGTYMDSHGPVRPEQYQDMATVAAAAGTPLPPLMPDATRTFPFNVTVTDGMRGAVRALGDRARSHGRQERELIAATGFDPEDSVETDRFDAAFTYQPGDEIDDVDDLFATRFMYAFWRLCGQQIAQITTAPVNHAAHLQSDRAGVDPEVRVVAIRPTARTDRADAMTARDWQHRWVVRMHKVRQWYPSEQRHKVIYRGPYIKGPADKPLLAGDVVRSLS